MESEERRDAPCSLRGLPRHHGARGDGPRGDIVSVEKRTNPGGSALASSCAAATRACQWSTRPSTTSSGSWPSSRTSCAATSRSPRPNSASRSSRSCAPCTGCFIRRPRRRAGAAQGDPAQPPPAHRDRRRRVRRHLGAGHPRGPPPEEIVGEITDEYDEDEIEVEHLAEGVVQVSSRFPVDDLEEIFGDDVEEEDVDSVGGLMAKHLGLVPIPGSSVEAHGLRFVAEDSAGRRNKIVTVLISRLEAGARRRRRRGPPRQTVATTAATTERTTRTNEHFFTRRFFFFFFFFFFLRAPPTRRGPARRPGRRGHKKLFLSTLAPALHPGKFYAPAPLKGPLVSRDDRRGATYAAVHRPPPAPPLQCLRARGLRRHVSRSPRAPRGSRPPSCSPTPRR